MGARVLINGTRYYSEPSNPPAGTAGFDTNCCSTPGVAFSIFNYDNSENSSAFVWNIFEQVDYPPAVPSHTLMSTAVTVQGNQIAGDLLSRTVWTGTGITGPNGFEVDFSIGVLSQNWNLMANVLINGTSWTAASYSDFLAASHQRQIRYFSSVWRRESSTLAPESRIE